MYQTTTVNKSYSEKDFNQLIDIFKSTIINENIYNQIKSFNDVFNIDNQLYTIKWSCIWNTPENINKQCYIFQKNNKLALVTFTDNISIENISSQLYRLEDLYVN